MKTGRLSFGLSVVKLDECRRRLCWFEYLDTGQSGWC